MFLTAFELCNIIAIEDAMEIDVLDALLVQPSTVSDRDKRIVTQRESVA